MAESGVTGGTVINGTGMAKALANMEDLPMFGLLRNMLADEEKETCSIMLFVNKDELVMSTRK